MANVAVDVNQFVGPGQPIVQLADRASLRVETTDLDEKDVARLNVGDQAAITFDALPGTNVTGKITRLAPKAKEGTGVNFTAVIELDQIPEAAQWGMTANAELTPPAQPQPLRHRPCATRRSAPMAKWCRRKRPRSASECPDNSAICAWMWDQP